MILAESEMLQDCFLIYARKQEDKTFQLVAIKKITLDFELFFSRFEEYLVSA